LVDNAMRATARLGLDIDGVRELEVVGRRSGKPRRTPVKVLVADDERYLVSLYGNSAWARNLRASRRARLRLGRRVESVVATELSDNEERPSFGPI
jgi:deazaflavin-dependent oxidoreductase (nitroreductase family)